MSAETRGGSTVGTLAGTLAVDTRRPDLLSGTPRAGAIDRWIFVIMAVWFIIITLAGFIPDSLKKIAAVQARERPAFPLILHLHAVLMASFLLLVLAQTTLMAKGRFDYHKQLGIAAFVLAPALVVVGVFLVPTMFHQTSDALQTATGAHRETLQNLLIRRENIMLVQMRMGILFPLFLVIGLRARSKDAGLHKRMMMLATGMALPFAINRITWLPNDFPASFITIDLYALAAIAPMFIWDVVRNLRIHQAYIIWLGVNVPFAAAVYGLWGTQWWEATSRQIMAV